MTNKEKLISRLLEGSHDIFTEFVVVGLEDSLETIIAEVKRLMQVKNLSDIQHTDLNELYHDGKAIIRVLQYYTSNYYTEQTKLMNSAWHKLLGEVL
jgi:hypothetical protein